MSCKYLYKMKNETISINVGWKEKNEDEKNFDRKKKKANDFLWYY
jgi:hypothetical protein